MTKKELVEKIAKEQGLDPKKLHRLNMEELLKMDKVVPDAPASSDDDLLGGESQEAPKSGDVSESSSDPVSTDANSAGAAESESSGSEGDAGNGEETLGSDQPSLPSQVGTDVVAEGPGSMDTVPSETPKSPSEVAAEQGQGDSGKDILPEPPADPVVEEVKEHVIIGYHPVTEEPVYLDEQ